MQTQQPTARPTMGPVNHLRRMPKNGKAAAVFAVLSLVLPFSMVSSIATNGVITQCSRLEVGAFGFGAAAIVAGLMALVQIAKDRKTAQENPNLIAPRWALNATTVQVAMVITVLGTAVGAYRLYWAISVANTCT